MASLTLCLLLQYYIIEMSLNHVRQLHSDRQIQSTFYGIKQCIKITIYSLYTFDQITFCAILDEKYKIIGSYYLKNST